MKKLAIIAALTLAIGASVTAGTMARYTQDLGTKDATVRTKQFNIIEVADTLNFDVKPGDKVEKQIFLDTVSVETDMNLRFEMKGIDKELIKTIEEAGGKFTVKNSLGQELDIDGFTNGNGFFYADQEVKSGVTGVMYTVSLDWSNPTINYNDDLTNRVQGKKTDFNVRIYAMQN